MKMTSNKKPYLLILLLIITVLSAVSSCAPKQYDITFESNGGNACLPLSVSGRHGILLPQPIKDGYRFDGWFFDDGVWSDMLTTTTYSNKRLKKDVTVYAKWTFAGYTVSFVSNGGSAVQSLTIAGGEKITAPPFTERQGYTFMGWCVDSALSDFYQLGTDINSSFTLYAKWLSNDDLQVFNIYFQPNNGEASFSAQVVEGNMLSLPSVSRVGYDFAGWYSDEGLTIVYNSGEVVTTAFTLYAKWQQNSNMFLFRFETDGGSQVADRWLARSETLTPPATVKENHIFEGWYSDADRTQIYDFDSGASANTTLYAKWRLKEAESRMFKVTFISDGEEVYSAELAKDSAVTSHSITKEGYVFVGWYKDSQLTQPYDFINNNAITQDTFLYAKWAESGEVSDGDFTYEAADGYYIITAFDGSGDVEIPGDYNGLPIEEIGNAVFANKNITSLSFSGNLKRIGIDAFNGVSGLSELLIPNTVENIGDRAFSNCLTLVSVEIHGNPVFGSAVFSGSGLSDIVLSGTISGISADMFRNCDSLISIALPDSVLTISQGAFYDCGLLSQVTFGSGLESIGPDAFGNCFALSSIDFENVKTIGNRAFERSGLISVSLPDTLTNIGQNSFGNCTKLIAVTIGAGLSGMDSSFRQSAIESFTVSEQNGVFLSIDGDLYTKDGSALLLYATGKSNTQFIVPEGVEEIREFAFAFASKLERITLSQTVSVVSATAFLEMAVFSQFDAESQYFSAQNGILYNAAKTAIIKYPQNNPTQSLVLPSGVETISPFAFYNARYLKKITLTDKITQIPEYAFYNAAALNEIIQNGAPLVSLGDYAFWGCGLLTEFVPPHASLTTIGKGCFAYSGLRYIGITNKITDIGSKAFENCAYLESVKIASGIENLNNGIFYNCAALIEIEFYDSPAAIGNAFERCSGINKITINGTGRITEISSGALPQTAVLRVQQSVLEQYSAMYGDMFSDIKAIV